MVDGLCNRDAEIAGEAIKTAILKLVPLNTEMGQSTLQQEAMNQHIEERAKYWVETNTLRRIREMFENEEFPAKLETAMREWANDNIVSRVSDCLDEMMCERTRSTITEYDLVRYTDDAYQEATAGTSDIDSSIEHWMDCNSSNYLPDNDELGQQIKEEIMDEVKEEAVDEDKVTSIITTFFKKSLHKVLGFAYHNDALSPSAIIEEKDLIQEKEGHATGYTAEELTRMKLRDARYGEILDALGQEDTDATWTAIYQKAKENV
tara:strand:- start:2391 stop:3179 length:789 start_codon:yes stop_codon:yes gene_type:complete